ncbi:hypothetical protein [Streptomyces diastatochromogenes]|uniref:Transposase (putative) YhgA-like domain-containing protein n=1 Tax=Streptomyces diastatochromogenes TaxID=42236 RepID=A0A233SFD4_STRDA|nr:hypothetical protein [Streptomyces diastatochromogenes]MCZ0989323.1 hypothetical protein [Streptomyces diastatochromogenes]OXY94363.1 hypothetical protein BEK98_19130 [Streptomyces diastatochromogenes]
MVSSSHEALHRIFQKDPALLTRALQQVLDVPFPEPREIAALNVDLTEIEPVERRVDTLLRAETDEGTYLLVVESQGKVDDRKQGSWPYYLSYLHEKYRCEPVLIVVTQNSATARWASRPIRLGFPGWESLTVRPLVLGPDNVPVIVDERQAERDVPLAVLSAMTHGRGPQAAAILESLASALRTIDPDSAAVFVQFVDSCLADPQAKQMWRDLMTAIQYFWRHPLAEQVREEGREQGLEQGRVEAKAEMVLHILEWRGIQVTDAVRERVEACTDLDQLEGWAQRAVHATDAEELFAEG